MRFEQYNFIPALKANLQSLGYKRPTDIQYKAIPPTLKGQDLLAIAQTGTGKTGAFAIPTIQLLVTKRIPCEPYTTQCLVMVPTHELAIQVANVFKDLAKGTNLHIVGIYGGVEQDTQIGLLKKGADVLVATPGRMFDLASQGYLKFSNVSMLIIDEADHMLELGFINDMEQLIRRIPRHRQTLFFSATINTHIKDLAYGLVNHAVRIQISPKDPISKNIDHSVAFIEMDDKRFFLENLVKENPTSKILVFVRTKVRAERVAKALERVEITSQTMHGSKTQEERSNILDRFKSGQNRILIATDVSARGIDIPNVEFVVNYDLPEIAQNYVHRVGRTGRATQRGKAVSFCSIEEKPILKQIEYFLNAPIAVLPISKTDYEATIDFSEASSHDWQSLIKEHKAFEQTKKKRKKKKR
ncbi:MAG TPA: DEAD/DEAH box helicase [Perlabentimonas sp.]|nr:DEAD/DEAH box helicase [Bacteroidales bacterium]MDD4672976.1 DEAD/DEAH box helicase [Bacteroidales bacterium]MDY0348511.1 DEAD/DEAH box helicase [Tenuifilaceae bacterium]HZJ73681.1 DEAD/DEAH box helicase [Perlabentimonas sp.]